MKKHFQTHLTKERRAGHTFKSSESLADSSLAKDNSCSKCPCAHDKIIQHKIQMSQLSERVKYMRHG